MIAFLHVTNMEILLTSFHNICIICNPTPHPTFFNTLYDPYRNGSDFVRGYPFSLREGVPTALSHGLWLNAPDYDAPTQLLKLEERNKVHADITMTVPAGILYPMCSMNVAFNRELIGPAFMQGLMGDGQPWARYDDMFAGWASKVVADHLHLGVKTGAPYIRHMKASNPFTNLKKEYKGLFWQEDLIKFFDRVRFKACNSPGTCYKELAGLIRKSFGHVHNYFGRLASAMETWVDVWNEAESGKIVFKPSRTSGKQREMAVLTILRNEPIYVRAWLLHYRQNFPDEDIYILDNNSTDDATKGLTVNVQQVGCDTYFDHNCLNNHVHKKVKELFDMGYTRVVFSEIDELVYARQGLRKFLCKMRSPVERVYSINLFERTEDNDPPMDWDKPPVPQRKYFHPAASMNKPLVMTKPQVWGAGFHNHLDPKTMQLIESYETAKPHPDLFMVHLQRADRKYFLKRAEWKNQQKFHEADAKAGLGWGAIKPTGKALEGFYEAARNVIEPIPSWFRDIAMVPGSKESCEDLMGNHRRR